MFRLILLVCLHAISVRTLFAQAHDYSVNNGKYYVCMREGTEPGHGFIWLYSRENDNGSAFQGTYVLRSGTPMTLEVALTDAWRLSITDATPTWVSRTKSMIDAEHKHVSFEWYDSDEGTVTLTHVTESAVFSVKYKNQVLAIERGAILKLKSCDVLPSEECLPPGLVSRADFKNRRAETPNLTYGGDRIFNRRHFGYVYRTPEQLSGVVYLDFTPDPDKKNSGKVWMVFHDFAPPDSMVPTPPKPPVQAMPAPTPDPVPVPISSSESRSKSRTRSAAKPVLPPTPPAPPELPTPPPPPVVNVVFAGHGWYSAEFTNGGVKVSLRFTRTFNHTSENDLGEWRASAAYRTGMDLKFGLEDCTVPDSPLAVIQDIFYIDEAGDLMTRRVTGQGFLGLGSKEVASTNCMYLFSHETLHFMEANAQTVERMPKLNHLSRVLLTDSPPGFDSDGVKQLISK